MKTSYREDQYTVIFYMADCSELPHRIGFSKTCQNMFNKNQKNTENFLKGFQKNDLGVSGGQERLGWLVKDNKIKIWGWKPHIERINIRSFSTGRIALSCHMGSTFSKIVQKNRNKMPNNVENWLKWVEKNDLGVSGGQERSKLRCGSIGSTPGPQNGHKNSKN